MIRVPRKHSGTGGYVIPGDTGGTGGTGGGGTTPPPPPAGDALRTYVLSTNPVWYLPLDDTDDVIDDASPNGHPGARQGTMAYVDSPQGRVLHAGPGLGYVRSAALGGSAFSMGAYVRWDGTTAGVPIAGGGGDPWWIMVGTDGSVDWAYYNRANNVDFAAHSSVKLTAGKWQYISFTYAGWDSPNVRLYIDGAQVGTFNPPYGIDPSAGYTTIGAHIDGSNTFHGDVGHVAAWTSRVEPTVMARLAADAVGTPWQRTAIAKSPTALWALDDPSGSAAASDSSGNGHTASITGGAQMGLPGVLPNETAMQLDGTDDLLRRTLGGVIPNGLYGDWSWDGWFNLQSTGSEQMLLEMTNYTYAVALRVLGNGNLCLTDYDGSTERRVNSTATYPFNGWAHVAVSCASGTVKIYLNGALILTSALRGGVLLDGNSLVLIGGHVTDIYEYLLMAHGYLDSVGFYLTALSAQDVIDIYNAGKPTLGG